MRSIRSGEHCGWEPLAGCESFKRPVGQDDQWMDGKVEKGSYGCWTKNRGRFLPPKWMVKIMENPMNKWMIWGAHPYFWKHPSYGCFFIRNTLPETDGSPLKIGWVPKGNEKVYQPSIFRCELLVSGRVSHLPHHFRGNINMKSHICFFLKTLRCEAIEYHGFVPKMLFLLKNLPF